MGDYNFRWTVFDRGCMYELLPAIQVGRSVFGTSYSIQFKLWKWVLELSWSDADDDPYTEEFDNDE